MHKKILLCSALILNAAAFCTAKPSPDARALLAKMSPGEKVGQLIIAGIGGLNGETDPEVFPTVLNKTQKKNLKKYTPGGVIFYGGNILNDKQIKKYIKALNKNSKIPLFISTDEEGGIVSRLGANPNISVTHLPKMIDLGAAGSPDEAYKAGLILGKEMKALGFNLDFAPVADVLTNPDNTVIHQKGRAFGTEPRIVSRMVPEFIKGMQSANVSATAKHFPGHGDVVADTHEGRVYSYADIERLKEVELLPFKAAATAGVDFIMTAHISLPKITGTDEPASMSKAIVTGLLKEESGFKGLAITDDMYMDAVRAHYGLGEAAVRSVNAGVDVIICKLFFEQVYAGLLKAAESGAISPERLDDAVLRILELKIKRGVIK
jgi:beta-N-acetylhexosaminidase